MTIPAEFTQARIAYHAALLESVLTVDSNGIASNADSASRISKEIASSIVAQLKGEIISKRLAGQTSGKKFEDISADFIRHTFTSLGHLRPGGWDVHQVGGRRRKEIAKYEQYAHLLQLEEAAKVNPALAAALGSDYTITPDIVVVRSSVSDEEINGREFLVDDEIARLSSLRARNAGSPLLHASISCKWTIRSDRAQNSRSEALNLIRNRKGRLPHIMVVTGEPVPARLASIALGTGDIDCVYHFALYELQEAARSLGFEEAQELLEVMVDGKRLKDISDLPLDLAV